MTTVLTWINTLLFSSLLHGPDSPNLLSPNFVPNSLLITSQAPNKQASIPQCATNAYYGSYGRPLQHIYGLDDECLLLTASVLDSGSISLPLVNELHVDSNAKRSLFWVQDAGVDASLRKETSFASDMGLLSANAREHLVSLRESGSIHQTQLGESGVLNADPYFEVVYQSSQGSGAIIAVDESVIPALDILLPPYVAAVMLPNQPAPFVPVSDKATERINSILAKLRFNPDIASVLSTLSVDSMRSNIRRLTGESPDPYGDYILSRHSFSKGARDAANWIQEQIEYSGATCRQEPFLEGYAPNVICRYPGPLGTANESMVLFSGHYDSRGSFGSTRAPGANDDGSGTVSVLAIARAIRENRIRFTKYAVELATFAGEEQGLRGSNSYARKLREQGRDVVVMVQADMLAYHSPGEPAQLGLPDLIGLPEVAQLIANVSKIYSPELTLGITPACCSDHQSFHYQGYPSTQVYERAGPIIDPMYHNTGDLSERRGYDLQQVRSIAKVTLATLLETAGFAFESD